MNNPSNNKISIIKQFKDISLFALYLNLIFMLFSLLPRLVLLLSCFSLLDSIYDVWIDALELDHSFLAFLLFLLHVNFILFLD